MNKKLQRLCYLLFKSVLFLLSSSSLSPVSPSYRAMLAGRATHKASTPSILMKLVSCFFKPHWRMSSCSFFSSRSASCLQNACDVALDSERSDDEYANVDWDKLGFRLIETDFMYTMKCSQDEEFSQGQLDRYGNIELSPSAGVLNYAQGLFEGLKAFRKLNGSGFLLFRPEENARRMQIGSDRMCMPSPSIEQFVHAVKQTVLANKRWIPPPGKGSLYVRPLLMGSGPVLGFAPASAYTFLVYAAPVGNYFKEGLAPINLVIQDEASRSFPGGTGAVKTIANYSPVLKANLRAKKNGFSDVLFLDSVHNKYLEEACSCNIFIRKNDVISTPLIRGTVLEGITRGSIMEIARDFGYQVVDRLVSVEDLIDADEVFCTGTAVVVAIVNSVTYKGQRYTYNCGEDDVSKRLHKLLTGIQMGLVEDKKGWTVEIE